MINLSVWCTVFLAVIPLTQEAPDPKRYIVVELKHQRLHAIENGQIVLTANCSTGKNNATPEGEWLIREKRRSNRALPAFGGVSIPYSLRLDVVKNGRRRLIAIHAHSHVPRRPASHGCIRLKHAEAKRLFEWATVGTLVRIEKKALLPEGENVANTQPKPN
jgi:lipoprotein-anchoring transpeptidase ErfK/SrfK